MGKVPFNAARARASIASHPPLAYVVSGAFVVVAMSMPSTLPSAPARPEGESGSVDNRRDP